MDTIVINGVHLLLYSSDDVRAFVRSLEAKGRFMHSDRGSRVGIKTTIKLPSGGEVGLDQPSHLTALHFR